MNSAAHSTKIPATKIEIVWSEAGEDLRSFATFAAFDAWARAVVATNDHCCKTEYRITWADGDTYTGRFDFVASSARAGLAAHLRQMAGVYARRIVPAMYVGREAELSRVLDATKNDAAVFGMILDTYRIGDADGSPNQEPEQTRLTPKPPAALFCGTKHDSARPLRESATLIRRDLAAAGKATTGPLAGCVCRVRIHQSRTSRAINVWIDSVPARGVPVLNPAYVQADEARIAPRPSRLSKRGEAIVKAAKEIMDAYNRELTSTRWHFYGDVGFSDVVEAAAREEIRTTLALLKQA